MEIDQKHKYIKIDQMKFSAKTCFEIDQEKKLTVKFENFFLSISKQFLYGIFFLINFEPFENICGWNFCF